MDLESVSRWEDYSRAKDDMFAATDNPDIPWMVVESDDKRSARLNMIAHLLSSVPWEPVHAPSCACRNGPRPSATSARRGSMFHQVPDHAATLVGGKAAGVRAYGVIA